MEKITKMERNLLYISRKQVDNIDNEILILLKRRFQVVKKIGKYKFDNELPFDDEQRFDEKVRDLVSKSREMDIDVSFVKGLFDQIFEESVKQERDVYDKCQLKKK